MQKEVKFSPQRLPQLWSVFLALSSIGIFGCGNIIRERNQEIPSDVTSYIVDKCKELGGAIIEEPFDLVKGQSILVGGNRIRFGSGEVMEIIPPDKGQVRVDRYGFLLQNEKNNKQQFRAIEVGKVPANAAYYRVLVLYNCADPRTPPVSGQRRATESRQ